MKRGLDWYKRDPQAIRMAIMAARMTAVQAAVYSLVIDLIYEGGGETPNEPKHIAAHFADVGAAKARTTISELVALGKLYVVDGMLHEKRAENEAKTKQKLGEKRAEIGQKGGIASGFSRRATKENRGLPEANASSKHEAEIEEEREKIGSGGGAQGDAAHDAILAAAGIDPLKDVTGKWISLSAQHEVESWRALGLSQDEIVAVIRDTVQPGRPPPGALSYFRQPMQRAAGRKAAAPLEPLPPEPQRGSSHGRRSEPPSRALEIADAAAERFVARRREVAERQDQGAAQPLLLPGGRTA